jgi:hypothetical protein
VLVALEDVAVFFLKDFLDDRLADEARDLLRGRPDVLEKDRLAVLAVPSGSLARSTCMEPAIA